MKNHHRLLAVLSVLGQASSAPFTAGTSLDGTTRPSELAPEARPDRTPAATLRTVLEGAVRTPEGWPAPGVVVVSSAGGQARTGVDGSFRLEVELPLEAHSVQVSAVQSSSQRVVGTVSVRPGRWNPAGILQLAEGTDCPPGWLPTFGPGGLAGTSGTAFALAVLDDHSGAGPGLIVAGAFGGIPGVNDIGRWNGLDWQPLGSGMNGWIRSLAVLDDGGGGVPRLFAGGDFTDAGGVAANRVAEWNGSSWAPLASGLNGPVHALAIFDDGGGPALYAGGEFTHAGAVGVYRIAKWNGSSWEALGSGVNGGTETLAVHALAVFDDGSGPALYAGGIFASAGGVEASHIARWNGSSWSALGAGREGRVFALVVCDGGDGGGAALYAGGKSATGVDANRIGKWNGSDWAPLGSGVNGDVRSLAAYDDGSGLAVYAGGAFTSAGGVAASRIARWNGSTWAPLSSGASDSVYSLAIFDDATERGPVLYAGGFFRSAGDALVNGLGEWNGSRWSAGRALSSSIQALEVFDDASGRGPALYAAGYFEYAAGLPAHGIARWNGLGWETLGSGLTNGVPFTLKVFDDGNGPKLYAGGSFTRAGGTEAWHIARWDGSVWSQVGALAGYLVSSLAVFDDGTGHGPQLYAGVRGNTTNSRVSRWNGSSWSTLGGLMSDDVLALVVHDDGLGGGPALYAAGAFLHAGGVPVNRIARWDGSSWSDVGGGMPGPASVESLAVFDDGSGAGPALYAGGFFGIAGFGAASHIAKWDGVRWSPLRTGLDGRVTALGSFDDGGGDGSVLLVGGEFTVAGGTAALGLAQWNGSGWSPFGEGTGPSFARALRAFDDGDGGGPALFVGFEQLASPAGDSFLARWQGCVDTSAPTLTCPTSVFVMDPPSSPAGEIVSFTVTASDRDPDAVLECTPPSGSFFPRGTTMVTCTATDASGNRSTCEFPVTVQRKVRQR